MSIACKSYEYDFDVKNASLQGIQRYQCKECGCNLLMKIKDRRTGKS